MIKCRDVITRTVGSVDREWGAAVVERAIREMVRVREAEERVRQEETKATKKKPKVTSDYYRSPTTELRISANIHCRWTRSRT
jgi:hypothetical protein